MGLGYWSCGYSSFKITKTTQKEINPMQINFSIDNVFVEFLIS
jgi:hypothetical protein